MVHLAVRVHRAHGQGPLGAVAAHPCGRKSVLPGGPGAVRIPRERARNPRRFDDRGAMGPCTGPIAARNRRDHGRIGPRAAAPVAAGFPFRPAPPARRHRASPGIMKPNIPPPLFAPQPAALAVSIAARDPLDVARAALLGPAELDENRIASVLGDVMGHAVDYTDIYFQLTREESWSLEDGIVKDGAHSIEQGVGVRALAGEKTGFAYSDEVMLPALLEAAHAARAISRSGAGGSVQAWHATGGRGLYWPSTRSRRWPTTTRSSCSSRSTARRARSIRASRR